MSLIRRLQGLLAAVLATALALAWALHLVAARNLGEAALQAGNADAARALAAQIAGEGGDARRTDALLAAQFDAGAYRRLRLMRDAGGDGFERSRGDTPQAPAWFVVLLPIESAPGTAAVPAAGATLEVIGLSAPVHDALWRDAWTVAGWLLAIGAFAQLAGARALAALRRPLQALAQQAQALGEGRFQRVALPAVAELLPVADALNTVVQRVRDDFEAQATLLGELRQRAHCDALTGLPHRHAFVEQFAALLAREDGIDGGALVLLRLGDLAGINREHGRDSADRALRVIAELLQAYPAHVADCLVGRLNGADFALVLPTRGMAAETASSLAAALASGLAGIGRGVHVHLGAIEFQRGHGVGDLLAAADLALARAESRGPFALDVGAVDAATPAGGEREWHAQVAAALQQRRVELGRFALLDALRRTVHLEAPLRLQLQPGGAFEPAARWLPLALRSRLAPEADLAALSLALEAIARDGVPRAVNVCAASIADGDFAIHVQQRLRDRPPPPSTLWLELPERVAIEQFEMLQRLAQALRPLGVRVGLEHAGAQLHRVERLYELGIDFVKLDVSLCAGVAASEAARQVLRATVALVHALSIKAFAEGVVDDVDAQVLFELGVDAVGGPWAARHAG